eukprot:COSAG02_NODE_5948_length_3919_cov_14.379581_3_plen_41_part_00
MHDILYYSTRSSTGSIGHREDPNSLMGAEYALIAVYDPPW